MHPILLTHTLHVTDDLTIYGPGADLLAVSGNGALRVFDIDAGVTVAISGLMIRDGQADDGGAGISNRGALTLREVVLTDNQSTADDGGAIYNWPTGNLQVEASTIHGNAATGAGAGIFNENTLTVINSTVSDNHGQRGAGIFSDGGTTDLRNSTIVNNSASVLGGGVRNANGVLSIGNSIVGDNVSPSSPDIASNNGVVSLGHNLISIVSGSGLINGLNGDQVGTPSNPIDPVIGVLRNLGGPTPVHGLLPTSPAIEAGNPATAQPFDQRGVVRPVGNTPDIGAFEYEAPTLINPVVVDSLLGLADGYFAPGELSLGEAILFANDSANHPSLDTIVFDANLFVDGDGNDLDLLEIDASLEQFVIADDLTLMGPGVSKLSILGSPQAATNSLFTIQPTVTASLSGLALGNHQSTNGGAIHNQGTLSLDELYLFGSSANLGGAIFNDGTLTIANSTLANNQAGNGGGVFNQGQAFLSNSTISGNDASNGQGGGISNENAGALLELKHVTLVDNFGLFGGGFYNGFDATIRFGNTIIAGNQTGTTGPEGFNEGTMETLGGNLIGTNIDLFLTPLPSDLILATGQNGDTGFETFLGRLQSVGDHSIPVHPVLPNSPAKDLGIIANSLPTDQRGVARPVFAGFDAGAFELEDFVWDTQLVVDSFSDKLDGEYGPGSLTLREALLWSNFKGRFECRTWLA